MVKALADCLPKKKALPTPDDPDNGSVATKGKPTLENKMALQAVPEACMCGCEVA